uniref:Uncharacterized protein n=1 Tax=Globodera rostochiensis TaxID=31243 RepID=A0A914I1Z2_GLORO
MPFKYLNWTICYRFGPKNGQLNPLKRERGMAVKFAVSTWHFYKKKRRIGADGGIPEEFKHGDGKIGMQKYGHQPRCSKDKRMRRKLRMIGHSFMAHIGIIGPLRASSHSEVTA